MILSKLIYNVYTLGSTPVTFLQPVMPNYTRLPDPQFTLTKSSRSWTVAFVGEYNIDRDHLAQKTRN